MEGSLSPTSNLGRPEFTAKVISLPKERESTDPTVTCRAAQVYDINFIDIEGQYHSNVTIHNQFL